MGIPEEVRRRFEAATGQRVRDRQILLVGSNPLPVAVAGLALTPSELVLVYTMKVKPYAERLKAFFLARLPASRVVECCVDDGASDAAIVRGLCTVISDAGGYGLHYTGGTKAMAVHSRLWWGAKNQRAEHHASYLGADGMLRFDGTNLEISVDDGPDIPIRENIALHLDLSDKTILGATVPAADDQFAKWAEEIHEQLADPTTPSDYWARQLPPVRGKALEPLRGGPAVAFDYEATADKNFKVDGPFAAHSMDLSWAGGSATGTFEQFCALYDRGLAAKRADDQKASRLSAYKWLEGMWLEVWLARRLEGLRDKTDPGSRMLFDEILTNVVVQKGTGKDKVDHFEADVVARRGYRAFLLSCTTATRKALVKSKLFEAQERAAQIGGDLAGVVMVSFYPSSPEDLINEIRVQGFSVHENTTLVGVRDVMQPAELDARVRKLVLR